MAISPARQGWAACLALALHNCEEIAGDLPGWVAAQPQLGLMARLHGGQWFMPAAIILVVFAALFALWAQIAPRPWMGRALGLFALVMLVNVLSHVALSMLTGTLMPGVVTAIGVVAPVFLWIGLSGLGAKKSPGLTGAPGAKP